MLNKIIECCTQNGMDLSRAHLTYNTCINLIEDRKYWDVRWDYLEGELHCTAKCSRDGPIKYFIPMSTTDAYTIDRVKRLHELFQQKTICIAIQSPDATILYYEVTDGLARVQPEKPEKLHPDSHLRTHAKQFLTELHRAPHTNKPCD